MRLLFTRSEQEEEKNPNKFIYVAPTITVHPQEEIRPKKGRRQKYSDSQAELNAATYHLTLENHREKTQHNQLQQETFQHDKSDRSVSFIIRMFMLSNIVLFLFFLSMK